MQSYGRCPVCTQLVPSGTQRCPRCSWELEGEYLLSRLTTQEATAHQEQMAAARQEWQKRWQRETTQRALAAAEANLAWQQWRCEKPQRYDVAHDVPSLSQPSSTAATEEARHPEEGSSQPLSSASNPRHWRAFLAWLFLGSSTVNERRKL